MAETVNCSSRVHWGVGRVAFHANKVEIEKLLQAGWPVKHVHSQLKDLLEGLSYRQFADYVSKMLPDAQPWQRKKRNAVASWRQQVSTSPGLAPKHFQPGPRMPDPKDIY